MIVGDGHFGLVLGWGGLVCTLRRVLIMFYRVTLVVIGSMQTL